MHSSQFPLALGPVSCVSWCSNLGYTHIPTIILFLTSVVEASRAAGNKSNPELQLDARLRLFLRLLQSAKCQACCERFHRDFFRNASGGIDAPDSTSSTYSIIQVLPHLESRGSDST